MQEEPVTPHYATCEFVWAAIEAFTSQLQVMAEVMQEEFPGQDGYAAIINLLSEFRKLEKS